jgi:hypothetical protein
METTDAKQRRSRFLDFAGIAIFESVDENDVIGHPSFGCFAFEMWVRASAQNHP